MSVEESSSAVSNEVIRLRAENTQLREALKEMITVLTVDNEYAEDSRSVLAIRAALGEEQKNG